jgi:hypothetical protein
VVQAVSCRSLNSSAGTGSGCGLNGQGSSPSGPRDCFLYATVSRPALGSTHLPLRWIPGLEADHSGIVAEGSLSNPQSFLLTIFSVMRYNCWYATNCLQGSLRGGGVLACIFNLCLRRKTSAARKETYFRRRESNSFTLFCSR